MLVERLIGRYVGSRVEMPFHVAKAAIKTGAVRPVNSPGVINQAIEPEPVAEVEPKVRRRRKAAKRR